MLVYTVASGTNIYNTATTYETMQTHECNFIKRVDWDCDVDPSSVHAAHRAANQFYLEYVVNMNRRNNGSGEMHAVVP